MKVRPLSKPLQEKAEKELNEVPNQIQKNLEILKNWLVKQEHLKYKDDDQFILNVLRASKFSLERAKEKLDAFYTYRTFAPEISRNLDPFLPNVQTHLSSTASFPLPTPTDDPIAPRVFFLCYSEYDPDEISVITMLKGESMTLNVCANNDDNYAISGIIIVWDLKGIKFRTATQATPAFVKKMVYWFEKAIPTRLKGIYIINMPKFTGTVFNLFKLLVSKKLATRLHFYPTNNLDAIFKDIPKSIFPKEYGGEAGSIEDLRAEWRKTLENNQEMLLNEDNYYSDESKRSEKSYTFENEFGLEGSFRNLHID